MKTADLIQALSADATPVRRAPVAPWLAGAGLAGAAIALAVLAMWLGFRPLHAAMRLPSFWMKAGYTLLLALAGLVATSRLGHPGARIGAALALAALPIAALAMMAMHETMRAPPAAMPALWLGQTWAICPVRILLLSLPAFALALWALRRAAPTRLALAGAAAGLFAGAAGATVYGLYCQEHTAAFVVLWYTLGIGLVGALGALAGPRFLRW
ncbi:MAG TPA: DUF1109 domain-containing protein [Caulobacteraceae bacterium]|jgi:hypothetical protein